MEEGGEEGGEEEGGEEGEGVEGGEGRRERGREVKLLEL